MIDAYRNLRESLHILVRNSAEINRILRKSFIFALTSSLSLSIFPTLYISSDRSERFDIYSELLQSDLIESDSLEGRCFTKPIHPTLNLFIPFTTRQIAAKSLQILPEASLDERHAVSRP